MMKFVVQNVRTVRCYHCHRPFPVSSHAISLTCPCCFRRVGLQDFTIRGPHSSTTLETVGWVLVERKGSLSGSRIHVGEWLEVEGRLDADVVCNGPVMIGPKAVWRGDLTAPTLIVAPGAVILGGFFRIGDEPA
jgi:Polymer-forming cytoskeletal